MELEDGKYRGRSKRALLGRAKGGTEQVGVLFDLLDMPGRSITWYGYFTDAAFGITMKGLRTAGFKGDDLSDLSSLDESSNPPEVLLVVENERYEGKLSPKVKFINSVGGLAMKDQMQGQDLDKFARRMKARIAAFDKSSGAKPAPKQTSGRPVEASQPPGDEDVDLPF